MKGKDKKKGKDVYILWVRHCESCSNVASKFSAERQLRLPLCTKKGILQSLLFGKRLKRNINNIYTKYGLLRCKFYSSYLPRAMLTSKLITNSFLKVDGGEKEIHRVPYVAEHHNIVNKTIGKFLDTQSSISSETSNRYALALNKLFLNTYPIVVKKKGNNKRIEKSDKDYYNFLTKILPKLDSGSLHVIATHGIFLRKDVLNHIDPKWNDKKYKPHNLDSYLVRYRDGVPKLIKSKFDRLVYLGVQDMGKYDADKIIMPLISKNSYNNDIRKKIISCKYDNKDIV